MRIFSWNVNGVRAIEKKGFLDWVDATAPDILCIQETKAHFEQLPESLKSVDGYHGYWHSGERKGYSGVATFSKEEPLHVQYGLGIEKYDREGRVLITEFENFLLYNIYFPNGQKDEHRLQYKLDFYDDLLEILNPIINSKSLWKSHALYLLAEYFYSKNEKQKSKEFFNQILVLPNANSTIKTESQKRLNRDLGE